MAGNRTLKLSILADVDDLKKKLDTGSKEVEGFSGKMEKFGKMAAAAFAAAAAAAAAYAVKLAVDGVKAAIEDEAAQNRLANALKNVTGATEDQIKSVEDQISKMSLANGIADDELRPAFQRLATATGDLSKANDSLSLALDISAATGKSVESVSNALGKAYEGNTTALARLGVGLSTAEIKSLGLDGTMNQLAQTFGGAASVQANTLEGQINRLKIGFDEAKESVGAALLPIVQKLMDYFVNVLIPKFQEAKAAAIDPIIEAFKNNEQALRDLWEFTKTYLVPIFENTLVKAITGVGKAIAGIVNIIGAVVTQIQSLVNTAIGAINRVIDAYNKIPILPNVPRISGIGSTSSGTSGGGSAAGQTIQIPGGGNVTVSGATAASSAASGAASSASAAAAASAATAAASASSSATKAAESVAKATEAVEKVVEKVVESPSWMPSLTSVADFRAKESGDIINVPPTITSNFDPARFRMREEGITIVVQAPSAIDEDGFSRAVTEALNRTQARTGGGLGVLID